MVGQDVLKMLYRMPDDPPPPPCVRGPPRPLLPPVPAFRSGETGAGPGAGAAADEVHPVERAGSEAGPAEEDGGGKRRRVMEVERERGREEAGPGGQREHRAGNGGGGTGASRFRGVGKLKGRKAKPWRADIQVTEDGKRRHILIGTFAREEDAAGAYDRVSIAKLGHAQAKTNFPVTEYRAEWAELEALGMDGAVALMMEHATAERPDLLNKASRFRGVYKVKGAKAKPWRAEIKVTEEGKRRCISIGTFAREEDAARAFDRVSIAKLGHVEAKTNFPAVEYRARWAELEALGVDGAAAMERERVATEPPDVINKASRFRGVSRDKRGKTKPWTAQITVTEDGKQRKIHIATSSREEDAARAFDRVNIAKLGHAQAKTNFPVAEYRAEWAQLEALGMDGAAALVRECAAKREWGGCGAEVEEVEDIKIRTLARAVEAGGGKRKRRVVMEREAAPSTPGGVRGNGSKQGTEGPCGSLFRGVTKDKRMKSKPWRAEIHVTKDGKLRKITIAYFAREEDAAGAYDRVNIAKLGHAQAKTNFPVAEYRAEWAELEALGVDGAAALMREHAAAERADVMDKASRFRGVTKDKRRMAKPWKAKIQVTEDGKRRYISIGCFAREEDAARAFDRASIAKLGPGKAKTNFPVGEYRAEWAELEAMGVDGAALRERQRAKLLDPLLTAVHL